MAQKDGETKTIGNHTFKVLMLDPLVAGDLLIDLTQMFGPALASLVSSAADPEASSDIASLIKDLNAEEGVEVSGGSAAALLGLLDKGLESSVMNLVEKLDKAKIREMMDTLAEVSSVKVMRDGRESWPALRHVFSEIFRGNVMLMYKWFFFAVKAQFFS